MAEAGGNPVAVGGSKWQRVSEALKRSKFETFKVLTPTRLKNSHGKLVDVPVGQLLHNVWVYQAKYKSSNRGHR